MTSPFRRGRLSVLVEAGRRLSQPGRCGPGEAHRHPPGVPTGAPVGERACGDADSQVIAYARAVQQGSILAAAGGTGWSDNPVQRPPWVGSSTVSTQTSALMRKAAAKRGTGFLAAPGEREPNLAFTPTFTMPLLRKDFDLGLAAARELEVPMPLAAATAQLVAGAIGAGHVEEDFAALIVEQARNSGITLEAQNFPVDDGLSPHA